MLTSRGLLLLFGAIHAAMLGYDWLHPDRFLRCDRADERIGVIREFAEIWSRGGDSAAFVAGHGIPGDWLPQALLYLAGGQPLVIAVQVGLVLLSLQWVREIALRLGLGTAGAGAAACLYGLLPHTLVFPHQLAAEAIFVPLVILSFRLAFGAAAGLALGAATLIRPITLLWPLVCAAAARADARTRAAYLAVALAPVLAWMTFVFAASGEFSLGRSGHDLGHNLYQRMHRMAAALPDAERPAPRPAGQTSATPGEYLRFVAQHPAAAAMHGARDVMTFGVKSGVERLVLDYLDLFPQMRAGLQDSREGWRAQVERRGIASAMLGLLRAQPGPLLVSAGAALFFAAFMLLALCGAWTLLRRLAAERGRHAEVWHLGCLIVGFVLYIVLTAQVIDAAQSRHRAPAEFALCLLAVAGWLSLRRAARRPAPAAPLAPGMSPGT